MSERDRLPIGVFDSGVGGLTVVKEIVAALPEESIVFLGDTARVPYGNRGDAVITRFALEMAGFLCDQGVKYLVAACNTISSTCLDAVRAIAPVPVLGVVDPAVEEALSCSRSRRIGVIGTRATIASGFYERRIKALDPGVVVSSRPCPMFVPLAEECLLESPATRLLAEEYLAGFVDEGIDVLILACTHYPLLRTVIGDVVGPTVSLVDSAAPTARELKALLSAAGLASEGAGADYNLYVTDAPDRARRVASSFFGGDLPGRLEQVSLGVMD